ncbi:MAG: beta/alpha barrel domain-containing protein [Candidatus Methanofastidiosia archaeon]
MKLRHSSVLAAHSGRNDGPFCRELGDFGLGMVTIGGISVDDVSKTQSKKMVQRGRDEFVAANHEQFIRENVGIAKESGATVAVNIRSSSIKGYLEAATVIADCGGVVEIDAHCRQKEIMDVGAGQALLYNFSKLQEILWQIKNELDVETILKFRGNVVSETSIAVAVEGCCDALHVDAMLTGVNAPDIDVFRKIPDNIFLIGNNSVRDVESAKAILEYCDAFSFSRIASEKEIVRDIIENT